MKPQLSLVLNSDFSTWSVISYKRALVQSFKFQQFGTGLQPVDYYKEDALTTNNFHIPIPAVLRMLNYVSVTKAKIVFTKKAVYIRDNYTCLYCGKTKQKHELTFDHIIPKSQWKYSGTSTNWENVATSCVPCNRRKANKTPEQAGMKLLKAPCRPNSGQYNILGLEYGEIIQKEWIPYIPPNLMSLYKIR